jgi:hypothetical protein
MNAANKNHLIVVYCAFEKKPVGVYNGPYHTDNLETIFRDFNSVDGSEREMTGKLRIRSMSVGDRVCVNDVWFRCADMGWEKV